MQEKCSERHVTFQVFAFSEFAATFAKNNNKTTKTKKDETFFLRYYMLWYANIRLKRHV